MDTLANYRQIIRQIIMEYAQYKPSIGEIEVETILDEEQDHYELFHTGWSGPYRVHGSVIHIDIRDGKVWLQHDGTGADIAEELVQAGIPRNQIVLGFKSSEMRPYTDFATV